MDKTKSLIEYFTKKYPQYSAELHLLFYFNQGGSVTLPANILTEINVFIAGFDEGEAVGYYNAAKKAAKEYAKNIEEIVEKVSIAEYNLGVFAGTEIEKLRSFIPSNSYDIEVFAVKSSNDFETGKQAFIGYTLRDKDGNENFHYKQIQFAAPNLTIKPKINGQDSLESKQIS